MAKDDFNNFRLPEQLDELKELTQWVGYALEWDESRGKYKKTPKNPHTGGNAQSSNPETWGRYEDAIKAVDRYRFDGVGFEFAQGRGGIDLDNVVDENGTLKPFASDIVALMDSYTEYSPSGTGLHILFKTTDSEIGTRKRDDKLGLEMYTSGRFFTITGKVYGEPKPINERTEQARKVYKRYFEKPKVAKKPIHQPVDFSLTTGEIWQKMFESRNGDQIRALYSGDLSSYGGDWSRADQALANHLAFWTQRNSQLIDEMFRESGLMRRKWDERRGAATYGERTINKAMEDVTEVYEPPERRTPKSRKRKKAPDMNSTVVCGVIPGLVDKLKEINACVNYPSNDLGGAALFADVFKNKCRYSPTIKDWMFYDGIKWRRDYEGMAARNSCKRLADALLQYAVNCPLDDKSKTDYLKYAVSLTNANRRNTIVSDSRDINCFTSEEMDVDDHLLNVQNGTLDLNGDRPIFRHHNADDLLSKVCGVGYEPSVKCPLWEKTLNEIFEGDAKKIDYLQRLLGYVLTGETKEEQMYFLYGSTSRNGKSTITETVLYILGDYGQTISPETLAIKANRDSRNASPDIAKLAGARLVIASEPPKRMLFDSALVKTLTGRDRISARFLHENEFSYTPRFKLILNTNYLPTISDQTIFMSGRIKVIEFNRHFSDAEQDKTLKEKLRAEASGILDWMIEGYEKYKTDGLTPPESVIAATENYATDSDKMQRFINERLIESERNSGAGAVYKFYVDWCKSSGYGIESKGNFFSDLKAKGIFRDRGTVNGVTTKNVIVGYEVDEFETVEPDEITPFQ